ncbi:MAG: transporter suffix domain-containing protein [Acidobacteria bacterium]|nr:transporter suffix domain-containing protein [Acidobacteriota bacterium]
MGNGVRAARPADGRWARVGVILMASSLPLWPALLGVPFLPLSLAAQGAVATGIVIVAEVAFWGGAALAGPEAARRMRSWWRRRPAR